MRVPWKSFVNLTGSKCFKNPEKPTCIDLILTNQATYFQLSTALETGLSYFHFLTVTEFKLGFTNSKPRIITYWDYKNFDNNSIRSETQSLC